jgi:hypothetical protein
MNSYFSNEDEDELKQGAPDHNIYLSVVVNNAGEYVARIATHVKNTGINDFNGGVKDYEFEFIAYWDLRIIHLMDVPTYLTDRITECVADREDRNVKAKALKNKKVNTGWQGNSVNYKKPIEPVDTGDFGDWWETPRNNDDIWPSLFEEDVVTPSFSPYGHPDDPAVTLDEAFLAHWYTLCAEKVHIKIQEFNNHCFDCSSEAMQHVFGSITDLLEVRDYPQMYLLYLADMIKRNSESFPIVKAREGMLHALDSKYREITKP